MKKNLFILIALVLVILLLNYENIYEAYLKLKDMFLQTVKNTDRNTYNIFLNLFLLLCIFYFYDRLKLKKLNTRLQKQISTITKELEEKQNILSQKSKMAAMGEMMDSIAHQWIQPISIIRMKIQIMQMEYEVERLTNKDIEDTISGISIQTDHLVNTMDEFRSFFRPSLKVEDIAVYSLVSSALSLITDELKKNLITTDVIGDRSLNISVNPSEFKHVLINMINNAKDAFIQKGIKKREIVFEITKIKNKVALRICDNAGGIPSDIVQNIFDPYFTTKRDSGGSGIGLHMAKQIIEKYKGKILVENIACGTCFIIEI